jgi:hypothetical protein
MPLIVKWGQSFFIGGVFKRARWQTSNKFQTVAASSKSTHGINGSGRASLQETLYL